MDEVTIHMLNCRCTRIDRETRIMFIKADCTRCNGRGVVFLKDEDIWKYNGISIA